MPYIKLDARVDYEGELTNLISMLSGAPIGHLTYILYVLCSTFHNHPLTYAQGNAVIGSLECVKAEYYRRILTPYEDQKIEENGDVD